MEMICQLAAQKKWPVFLLGGEEGVAEKTAENLKNKYPDLEIQTTGIILGTVPKGQSFRRPAILFVALGASKQEKWIINNLAKMPSVKLAMGVGGAFDFISGRVRRAPKPLRLIGVEWLWRLFCQPWRMGRIFNAVVKFPYLVIKSTKER